jgi:fimbrial chaperone protein
MKKLVLALMMAATFRVAALTVTPMSIELTETGAGSTASFRIENDSDAPIAVIVSVMTRAIEPDGTERNAPAGTDFLVMPSRLVLDPRSARVVKVQWRGSAPLSVERAYRVLVEQVPVSFGESGGSGIRIMFRYLAALYVVPAGAAGRLSLASVIPAVRGGLTGLLVTVRNDGNKHFITSNPRLLVRGESEEREFSGDALSGLSGLNILARSRREVFIPWAGARMGTTYAGVFSADNE